MWSLDPPSKRLEKVYSLTGLEREDHSLSGDLKYYCLEYKLYGHRATVFWICFAIESGNCLLFYRGSDVSVLEFYWLSVVECVRQKIEKLNQE